MTEKFNPQKQKYTVVYDSNSNEIDRKEGFAEIKPKDYKEHLPIEYKYITITTEIISIIRIEKQ